MKWRLFFLSVIGIAVPNVLMIAEIKFCQINQFCFQLDLSLMLKAEDVIEIFLC